MEKHAIACISVSFVFVVSRVSLSLLCVFSFVPFVNLWILLISLLVHVSHYPIFIYSLPCIFYSPQNILVKIILIKVVRISPHYQVEA